MSRRTTFAVVCLLLFTAGGCSRNADGSYAAPGGEFSYAPPEGWVLREMPGMKYQIAFGRPSEGFAPNINVGDEYAPVTLDEYVAGSLQVMPQMYEKVGYKHLAMLDQAEFTTGSNQRGIRVVTESEMNGKRIRQTFYFFDGGGGKKFVLTCSVPAAAAEGYDKLFDASMKTFKTGRA
jgi:hypothetical protein